MTKAGVKNLMLKNIKELNERFNLGWVVGDVTQGKWYLNVDILVPSLDISFLKTHNYYNDKLNYKPETPEGLIEEAKDHLFYGWINTDHKRVTYYKQIIAKIEVVLEKEALESLMQESKAPTKTRKL